VPPDVTILNWNHGNARRASAEFFAERGHRQVLAGYYDADPANFSDRQWLADLAGVPGITGVMYTQWGSGYDNLEAWARHVWGDAVWVTPTPPSAASSTPSASPTPTATRAPATPTATVAPTERTTATPVGRRAWLPWGEKR